MMVLSVPVEEIAEVFTERTQSASITEWAKQCSLNKRTLTKIINGARVQTKSMKKLAVYLDRPLTEISKAALLLAVMQPHTQ